jgi:hypothetical protein
MSERLTEIEDRAAAATKGPWVADGGTFSRSPYQLPVAVPGNGVADSAFIAHAREDVPWLVARIRELEGVA